MRDIEAALTVLEEQWEITPPLGSESMPPRMRFSTVLSRLAKTICPKRDEIQKVLDSKEFEVGTIAVDALGSWVTKTPFVWTQILSMLCSIGLDAFCKDPGLLVEPPSVSG